MAKITYTTAPLENGDILTRTTDRTYTHVVYSIDEQGKTWVWGWCGRYDLALKTSKGTGKIAEVFPVEKKSKGKKGAEVAPVPPVLTPEEAVLKALQSNGAMWSFSAIRKHTGLNAFDLKHALDALIDTERVERRFFEQTFRIYYNVIEEDSTPEIDPVQARVLELMSDGKSRNEVQIRVKLGLGHDEGITAIIALKNAGRLSERETGFARLYTTTA